MREEQNKKLRTLFYRLILIMLIIISGYILYRCLFHINGGVANLSIYNSEIKTSDLKPVVLLLGMIVYIGCITKLYYIFLRPKFSNTRTLFIGVGVTVVFFIGLFLYASTVTVNPTYDLSHIKRTIYGTMTGNSELNNNYYYKRYPNNIALLLLVRAVMAIGTLFGIENLSMIGNLLGSATLAVTAFLCFLTARKLSGNGVALLVLTVFVTNPLFYLYSSYYYTDVMSMPFSLFAIYLFVCFCKSEQHSRDYWMLIGAGMSLGIGYKIRATVILLFIAMMVWGVTRFQVKTTVKVVLILVLGMAPAFVGFKALYATDVLASDKNAEFPISHWLMMGLNEQSEGKYNGEDFRLTSSYKTYEEKVSFNSAEIVNRVKKKGAGGLLEHCKEKLAIVWSDGYGIPSTFRNIERYSTAYDYTIGTKSIFLRYYAQICRCSLWLLMLLYFINEFRKKEPMISMLEIALLGAIVFYLLWEANERYSVSFLPWMLLLMAEGVRLLERFAQLEVLSYKKRDWKVKTRSLYQVAAVVIMASSVFFMIGNDSTYTTEQKVYTDAAFTLPRGKIKVQEVLVGKKKIKQEFSTSRAFNELTLIVNGRKCKTLTNYIVSLRKDGKTIRKLAFTSDQIRYKDSITLTFDTVRPKKETVYTLTVRSLDAVKGDSVKLISSYHCDGIKHKALTVNGKEMPRNLAVYVNNHAKRSYVSRTVYFVLCLLILGSELFCFGGLFRRKNS